MLLSILRGSGSPMEKLLMVLISVFCVLLSLSVHEVGHGLAAYALGDRTAQSRGRLSLNPVHHIDPIGGICLLLFGFGWARPVPVNPYNFKNQKSGMVLTSLAGPLTNFVLAFIAEFGVVVLGGMTFKSQGFGFDLASVVYTIFLYMVYMNLGLGLFNLIPIPPLDGSKVLGAVLPTDKYFRYMQYERYGFIILILLMNFGIFNSFLSLCESGIMSFYDMIIGLFV